MLSGCRVSGQVPGAGSVSSPLGRWLRHGHHAGDRCAAAAPPRSLRPAFQDTGAHACTHTHTLILQFFSSLFLIRLCLVTCRTPAGSGWGSRSTWWSASTCCCQDTSTTPAECRPTTGKTPSCRGCCGMQLSFSTRVLSVFLITNTLGCKSHKASLDLSRRVIFSPLFAASSSISWFIKHSKCLGSDGGKGQH